MKSLDTETLRGPLLRRVVRDTALPENSSGIDVGCGIGLLTAELADAVGPRGRVTAIDTSFEMIKLARLVLCRDEVPSNVSFTQADMCKLPLPNASQDWVWSCDCAGYAPYEPAMILTEFFRALRPGGIAILAGWSSQQLLPGHPELEAALNGTESGIAPFRCGMPPDRHFLRLLGPLHDAGFQNASVRTYVGQVSAPLTPDEHQALISLLDMRWSEPQDELDDELVEEYERLCMSASPDFILNEPDYYAFFTYSVFRAEKPARS